MKLSEHLKGYISPNALCKLIKLEDELETYRERHRDTKSNYATMQRLREENNKLRTELDKIAVRAYINTLEGKDD